MKIKGSIIFFVIFFFNLLWPNIGLSQIIKGLSFGKNYTVERIAEIYYDKDIDIEKAYETSYRIKVALSERKYHYLLIELDKYDELKGGKLRRMLLSDVSLEEADKQFLNCLSLYGNPKSGWEEISDTVEPAGRRVISYNKSLLYQNKYKKGDALVVSLRPGIDDLYHSFEVGYYESSEYVNLENNRPFATLFDDWKIYKKYGRTITVH